MSSAVAAPGAVRFARYAFPPNELGYCGPDDVSGVAELAGRAREFDGAWPYLTALAGEAGDPLDPAVVQAYWIGGPLLDRVDGDGLIRALRAAFRGQASGVLGSVAGAIAHHSFHVFAVYPWIRFLGTAPALNVLQQCRIRWGTVESVDGDMLTMSSPALTYDGTGLHLGAADTETVRWRAGAMTLPEPPREGDMVAVHWNWVCERITAAEAAALSDATDRALALVQAAKRCSAPNCVSAIGAESSPQA